MSSQLWRYYLEDDVEGFRQFLETANYTTRPTAQKGYTGGFARDAAATVGSPGDLSTSPTLTAKGRKSQAWGPVNAGNVTLTRADINWKDANGLTLLHHAASSTNPNATAFGTALLEHPLLDLYTQDLENGWTALHRAFYFGNITLARAILLRDSQDALNRGSKQHVGGLIKIKDKEGNGPFDLLSATIKDRTLRPEEDRIRREALDDENEDEQEGTDDEGEESARRRNAIPMKNIHGDEVFTFGSNKNITLGFGDGDDRQFPERIHFKRPDHLLRRFYREHVRAQREKWSWLDPSSNNSVDLGSIKSMPVSALPSVVRNKPLVIQDVQMSKLSTAVLTTDPESNLYMCGHGHGGRLGNGNEITQFNFVCIEGGALEKKKVAAVALGQDHSIALSDSGEVFTWGTDKFGQLGYSLSRPSLRDEDPVQTLPRQIFGPLKREVVTGIAASRIHSVCHTAQSLYTFGKNEGQLGIMDADARSLDAQVIPRKVAASLFQADIAAVAAIDRATVVLLDSRDVWVFANYGYSKLNFNLEGFWNYFLKNSFLTTRYDTTPNQISKITCAGDTICALSTSGEVYTVNVSQRTEPAQVTGSTTNPNKIRGALSTPQRIWSLKKGHMAARDVGVDHDGSIIITTEAGTAWRRTRRAKIKDASAAGTSDYKPKDYKFSRVPALTRATAVRASAFGAYSAVRKDCDVTRTQVIVDDQTLWKDIYPLLPFRKFGTREEASDDENPAPRFWRRPSELATLRKRILESKDLENDLAGVLETAAVDDAALAVDICTTISEVKIPIHQFILTGRSRIMRQGLSTFRQIGSFEIPELLAINLSEEGKTTVTFQGLDFLTLVDFVLYLYTDSVVQFWQFTRHSPNLAFRYRQIRVELMRVATALDMRRLEPAVRQITDVKTSMDMDYDLAQRDAMFFEDGDTELELDGESILVHSAFLVQRCPFLEGMFKGRAGGLWIAGRRDLALEKQETIKIDLKHIDPDIFKLVLRYLYADVGEELFDDVVSDDLDGFLDLILEVMSIANELMLDRLSQICQKVLGRHVNVRNICQLLNAVAPSTVSEFKDAGLEYLCLSLESMLENGLLDELDEDLMYELDQVVRDNQLAYQPFVRSGRAEALLLEKYPEMAERLDRGRQQKLDSIMLLSKYSEQDGRVSSSFKSHSLDEHLSTSPSQQRMRRKSSNQGKASVTNSPALNGKTSTADLMFDMDDDVGEPALSLETPVPSKQPRLDETLDDGPSAGTNLETRKAFGGGPSADITPLASPPTLGLHASQTPFTPAIPGRPWGATPLASQKLDLKDIMAQTTSQTSNISLGLSAQKADESARGSFTQKLSQKERKKLQQAHQLTAGPSTPALAEKAPSGAQSASPWQTPASGPKIALKDVLTPNNASAAPSTPLSRTPTAPSMTLRQTVANNGPAASPKVSSPIVHAAQAPTPARSVSQPQNAPQHPPRPTSRGHLSNHQIVGTPPGKPLTPARTQSTPVTTPIKPATPPVPQIQSIRHTVAPRHAEPTIQLSMADILSQQQREKDVIKEAVAKRSLQEIQQEQEFQQWWDAESKKAMEEEAKAHRAAERATKKAERGSRGGRGGGAKRGRGGSSAGKGVGEVRPPLEASIGPSGAASPSDTQPKRDDAGAARGRYRGRGGGGPGRGRGRGGHNVPTGAAPTPTSD